MCFLNVFPVLPIGVIKNDYCDIRLIGQFITNCDPQYMTSEIIMYSLSVLDNLRDIVINDIS